MFDTAVRKSLTALILLFYPLLSFAQDQPCQQDPTARCLVSQLIQEWPGLHQQNDGAISLAAHLIFEARQLQLSPPSFPINESQQAIIASLEKEEQFLQHLQQQQWQAAEKMLAELTSSLQDYWHSPPQALLLEALALALQDDTADRLKRDYYAALLELDESQRAERMLAIARHEILGGQPDKGQQTLAHSDVDAFSPSAFFLARRSTELLATRSRKMFLQPDIGLRQCSGPDDIGKALHQWLTDNILLTSDQNQLPDLQTRIMLQLSLARLHRNSAQCPLLERWFSHQAVSLATQLSKKAADAPLQRILIARTVRRYLN